MRSPTNSSDEGVLKRILSLAIAGPLAAPVAGLAQPTEEVILRSAERVAGGMELQSTAAGNRRSRGRTWSGMVLIAAGAVLTTAVKRTEVCSGGSCIREEERYKPLISTGIGLAVTGALLVSVWSDVPANPHVDFALTPDRIQVGKTFEF